MSRNIIMITLFGFLIVQQIFGADMQSSAVNLPQVRNEKTHVVPSFWGQMPQLKAKTCLNILDVNGPGVVTMIHSSALGTSMGAGFNSEAVKSVMVSVFYDGETKPSIRMPFMDFFSDIQCESAYFSTIYFSKVKESHNFRLQIPFRKHITIKVTNTSDVDLVGYVDVQWEELSSLPENCAYLYTNYKSGNINPDKPLTLFELNRPATIVAHWMQYESAKSPHGEVICEGNQEIYLDGDRTPTLNYLGTEDVYGYSWGYKGIQSDNFAAIIKQEDLNPSGSRIGILRCRERDTISFKQSCKWVLTYLTDPATIKTLGNTPVPYRHCVYFYAKSQPAELTNELRK
jgi:hypothetical protein